MLSVSRLAKSFGGRTLFEGVSLQLNEGSRYGLVGANGSGKTTFLKIVAGDEPASDGSVTIPSRARMGVLRQDQFMDDAKRIIDVAMMGDAPRGRPSRSARASSTVTATRRGSPTWKTRSPRGRLHPGGALHRGAGGARHPAKVHAHPSPLSGGFKLRVLLAQVLVGGPDILLLTNRPTTWTFSPSAGSEKFLAGYRGMALVISTTSASWTTPSRTSWTSTTARSPSTPGTTRPSWWRRPRPAPGRKRKSRARRRSSRRSERSWSASAPRPRRPSRPRAG